MMESFVELPKRYLVASLHCQLSKLSAIEAATGVEWGSSGALTIPDHEHDCDSSVKPSNSGYLCMRRGWSKIESSSNVDGSEEACVECLSAGSRQHTAIHLQPSVIILGSKKLSRDMKLNWRPPL